MAAGQPENYAPLLVSGRVRRSLSEAFEIVAGAVMVFVACTAFVVLAVR